MIKSTANAASLSVVLLGLLSGCTTEAAKKAMNKPAPHDAYTNPGPDVDNPSKRTVEKPKPVSEETAPEQAVSTLSDELLKDRYHQIPAEEQLRYWGAKQGVDKIVSGKMRMLLKNERVDVRAPALRLTVLFGGPEVNGDLIECLADSEYGIRETAFKALRARTRMDFGFNPSGGEVARAQSVQQWRTWWQARQSQTAVQPPSVYEQNPPTEPAIVKPGKKEKEKGR